MFLRYDVLETAVEDLCGSNSFPFVKIKILGLTFPMFFFTPDPYKPMFEA